MTTNSKSRQRRRVILGAFTTLVVLVAFAVYLIYRAIPEHRTVLLVDVSEVEKSSADGSTGHMAAIADAVGSAARNAGDGDALALRRFGGTCGDPASTTEVVGSGTDQGQRIADAARGLTAGGQATLESGILASIADFSGRWPLRGSKINRIVVVTSHGTDACTADQAAVTAAIADRITAAGLQLEFRYVGFRVPADQREPLLRLASTTGAPEPAFADSPTELDAILARVAVPAPLDAERVDVPNTNAPSSSSGASSNGSSSSGPVPPAEKKWPLLISLMTDWGVTVTGAPVKCHKDSMKISQRPCTVEMSEGERISLVATIEGPDPNQDALRNNPNYRPSKTLAWYGCDEGPQSKTCTVTMTQKRVEASRRLAERRNHSPTGGPGLIVCVTTPGDVRSLTLTYTCAQMTGASPPPRPAVTLADGSILDGD